MTEITVHKGREKLFSYECSEDLSGDAFVAEIRVGQRTTTPIIATWNIEFETDGKDGKLLLWLDAETTGAIVQDIGYTDIKRMRGGSGGSPVHMFSPIPVIFEEVVTA